LTHNVEFTWFRDPRLDDLRINYINEIKDELWRRKLIQIRKDDWEITKRKLVKELQKPICFNFAVDDGVLINSEYDNNYMLDLCIRPFIGVKTNAKSIKP
jgi:hypothetical protein